ncbi:flagellar FlbD family protein [Lacticigenium naphthae]|uniref:flagellar FlbD family protein n=1 Tax=Lacticigenium naphthae TaxID=515351 RepID=UPI0003F4BB75|nr:flagellar FlbD family protein [Lacticigenium naphthae]
MIELTSIVGESFLLNSELIYRIDWAHDTVITLIDLKKIRVKETPDTVAEKVLDYKREIYAYQREAEN